MLRVDLITSATVGAARAARPSHGAGASRDQRSATTSCSPTEARGAASFEAGPSFHWIARRRVVDAATTSARIDKRFFVRERDRAGLDRTSRSRLRRARFHYYCEHPPLLGHGGVVKVRPRRRVPARWPARLLVRWADSDDRTPASRFDVRYRVDHRKWKAWKNDTRKLPGHVRAQRQRQSNFSPIATRTRSRSAPSASRCPSAATGRRR